MNSMSEDIEGLDSFVFQPSFWVQYLDLTDPEMRLAFMDSLCRYGVTGELVSLDWPLRAIVKQCTISIDASKARYDAASYAGSKSSNKSSVTKSQIESMRKQTGSLKAAAKNLGISRSTAYNILNGSKKSVQRPDKCSVSKKLTNTYTDTYSLMGDTDKPCSHGEKTKEIISGSRGDPEKISEASAQEPPEGCEWIGEPYESGDFLCRQYNRVGTTDVGVMRFPL